MTRNTNKIKLDTQLRLSAVLRVSRRNGREGDSFISPDEQRRMIEVEAERLGAIIVSWHDETDSVSGSTTDREGLQAALAEVHSGASDGLIVAKVDRYSRNVSEGLEAIRQLTAAHKSFVACAESINTEGKSSPTGKVVITLMLMMAEWQLDTLKAGWLATRHKHVENGFYTHEPYGYRKSHAESRNGKLVGDKRLYPVADEAPNVRAIFEQRAERTSWVKIVDGLNADSRTRDGKLWTPGTVQAIVRNRVYVGAISSGSEIVNENAHEPIVSVELFERANDARSLVKRSDAFDYPLTGVLHCASCGCRMAGKASKRDTVKRGTVVDRYYTCKRRYSWGECERPTKINAAAVEAFVLDAFYAKFGGDCDVELVAPDVRELLDDAQRAVDEATAELHEYASSPAVAAMRKIDSDAFELGIESRTQAVVDARAALTAALNAQHGLDLPDDLSERWYDYDADTQRAYLSDAYHAIVVKPSTAATRRTIPIAERVDLFTTDEPNAPRFVGGTRIEVAA